MQTKQWRRSGAGDVGWVVVSATVGPAGEAVALMTPLADANLPGTPHPWRARALTINSGQATVTAIGELRLAHPTLQPLPGGGYVIVGRRCGFRGGDPERNAVVVGPGGDVLSELTFGDGIEDVQTSLQGDIWVSYFDEGVFGNRGWGGSGRSRPMGSAGLVRFGVDGAVQWEFEPPPGCDVICDCYALNVDGETAWISYHTGFPLVQVEAGRTRSWSTGIAGVRALAVSDGRVLLAGGYGDEADRVLVGRLGDRAVVGLVPVVIEVPGGQSWAAMTAVGRGSRLHLHRDGVWFAVDLRELPI